MDGLSIWEVGRGGTGVRGHSSHTLQFSTTCTPPVSPILTKIGYETYLLQRRIGRLVYSHLRVLFERFAKFSGHLLPVPFAPRSMGGGIL